VTLTLIAGGVQYKYLDDPKRTWLENNRHLYEWLTASTNPDSVFIANSSVTSLVVELPLFAKRAIFTGNGFPFREDDFTAFNERRFLVYGSPEDWEEIGGSWQGVNTSNFYRSRTPADFYAISEFHKLDYVMIEKDFSTSFSDYQPVYEDEQFFFYSVNDFSTLE
jgi:hypothetical protein